MKLQTKVQAQESKERQEEERQAAAKAAQQPKITTLSDMPYEEKRLSYEEQVSRAKQAAQKTSRPKLEADITVSLHPNEGDLNEPVRFVCFQNVNPAPRIGRFDWYASTGDLAVVAHKEYVIPRRIALVFVERKRGAILS